ncbi:LamG-like jellyroll fold domain-containing protein [Hymenobacter sp. B81]|uniref:LamG-like jellyroll fold domain-containing protein n=1 Tax=Hymenobacter sp. B81 TaxID=3344878 RepID=UPI0037DD6B86
MKRFYRSLLTGLALTLGVAAANPTQAQLRTFLRFDDNQPDKVTAPLTAPIGPYTVEAWVKSTGSSANTFATILEMGDDKPWFGIDGNGQLEVYPTISGGTVPRNVWTHVAFTWDGTTARLYVNATQVAANTDQPGLGGVGLAIGAEQADSYGWMGHIDEVMIWNGARTPAQLATDMAGYATAQAGMVAYFPFNENGGQTVDNLVVGAPDGVLGATTAAEVTDPVWQQELVQSARTGQVAASFTLDAVYPNPVRTQASIGFQLQKAGPVHLAVYDLTGRQVAVLAEGYRAAGRYAVPFAPAGLPGGLYQYRLSTDGQSLTRPLVLGR